MEATTKVKTVRHLDNVGAGGVTGTPEGIRYPGVGKMLLIWSAIGALTAARYLLFAPPGLGRVLLAEILGYMACYFPWAVLTPLVFRIEGRYPLGAPGWPRRLSLLAAISIPFCLLASLLMLGTFLAVRYAFGAPPPLPRSIAPWFGELLAAEAIFWCSVAGGYFLRTLFQLQAEERRAARLALEKSELEAGLNQAQLEVLRARLNPHFLFNSLQNISVLTKQDPQTASRMLTRLGDLLRAVLRHDSQPESTLEEEIELTRIYVSLEQMRFGDRLSVDFVIDQKVENAMVPCFLLQPLIENAIIHGLRGARKNGVITVSAKTQGNELVLGVTDNGVGLPAENSAGMKVGVGLRSICERLARMYPDGHTFSIEKRPEGGTEVRIALPLRFAGREEPVSDDEQTAIADR